MIAARRRGALALAASLAAWAAPLGAAADPARPPAADPARAPAADPARAPAADPARAPEGAAAELARLAGHRVAIAPDGSYRILDVAGEGAPRVGVVERRGQALWLRTAEGALRLAGPLAVPRIAGPGYKVWVLGEVDQSGALVARRLGVLAPPRR